MQKVPLPWDQGVRGHSQYRQTLGVPGIEKGSTHEIIADHE